jgi:phosphate transport system protein
MRIEERLQELEEMLLTMAELVRSMMEQAKDALMGNKKEQALFIIESDAHINNLELEINETVITTLSLLHPVAKDLRKVITALKIANDLERIGDYAKNIARYVIKNEHLPEMLRDEGEKIFAIFFNNFDMVIQVIKEGDVSLAYQAAEADELLNSAFKMIAGKIDEESKMNVPISFATVNLLRNIERAGDHTKNICEHIIYRVKAQYVDFG